MTHLPEVEVVRKELEREVVGKRVKSVTVKASSLVARHRNRPAFRRALEGRRIRSVTRRGVHLLLGLDDDHTLVIRPGPHATLTRETATAEAGRHTQMVATFTTGGSVHYTDPDQGGEMFVVADEALDGLADLTTRGIDPLGDTFTWQQIGRELAARRERLRVLLVDDTFVLGLGALYADEVLWSAGLAGTRRSDSLSAQEVRRLYRALLEVVHEAVKQGGSGEPEPGIDAEDDDGEVAAFIRVHGREGEPCGRCRQPIALVSLAPGVDAFACPQCQT